MKRMKIISLTKFIMIFVLFLILMNKNANASEEKSDLTLEDIFLSTKYSQKSLRSVKWFKDGKSFIYLETDSLTKRTNIWKYDVKSGKKSIFIDAAILVENEGDQPMKIVNYIISPDENSILFTESIPARAMKSGGKFSIYDLNSGKFYNLMNSHEGQMLIKFSPDSKKIGFVRENNLFVVDLLSRALTQLTFDGSKTVLNGNFDWVYEEEWGIIDGWHWSHDGKHIAFWQLDQSKVPEVPIVKYSTDSQKIETMRYPKSGETNSIARVGVISIETNKLVWMDIGDNTDIYIPNIKWSVSGDKILIYRVNRLQNIFELLSSDIFTGKSKIIFSEKSDTWLNIEDAAFHQLHDGRFIWSSERDGFNHLYLYTLDGKYKQITRGSWDVLSLAGVDEQKGIIYFTASEKSPTEKHLYKINFKGKIFKRISLETGTHYVNISPDHSVYIDTYSNVNHRSKISLHDNNGNFLRVIEENTNIEYDALEKPKKEIFSFKTSDGVDLNAWMIKPVNFNPDMKYPVLIYVYGGPGSQTVLNEWERNILWYTYLSRKGYIIASIDGRGTGARGKNFKKIVYKNLGKWETYDQIEGAKFLSSLPYVDSRRIGIWGASYGGYMACKSILTGNDIFKTAIASASVVDWKYYDTIYTERYMQTPELNPEGYKESSTLPYAEKLNGNLLLIHGTADDNVHIHNTIMLADELQKQGKRFSMMLYPNGHHGIGTGIIRLHLYKTITDFIFENL